jgi:uncharacterized iron-regulated protein
LKLNRPLRHITGGLGMLGALLANVGCSALAPQATPAERAVPTAASTTTAPPPRVPDLTGHPVVLLGEVHDNAVQHALRLAALQRLLASGARPALLMEQFDRERQPVLDRLRADSPRPTAQALIDAAGGPGWDWPLYRPYLEEALAHGLPIIAANVSRTEARRVIAEGLAAGGFDPAVPEAVNTAQAQAIVESHCGMVDAPMARRMATAQIARDQFMARLVEQHQARGLLLLAGNGHVRKDVGVPRWLAPATRARSRVIGLLEPGDTDTAPYDDVVLTARQPREDLCTAMRGTGTGTGTGTSAPKR